MATEYAPELVLDHAPRHAPGDCAGIRIFYVPGLNASGDLDALQRSLQQERCDRIAANVIEMLPNLPTSNAGQERGSALSNASLDVL